MKFNDITILLFIILLSWNILLFLLSSSYDDKISHEKNEFHHRICVTVIFGFLILLLNQTPLQFISYFIILPGFMGILCYSFSRIIR